MPFREFDWPTGPEPDAKPAPHVLRAVTMPQSTKLLLIVKKERGEQSFSLDIPVPIDDFASAWNSKRWEAVDTKTSGKDFFEIRFVRMKSMYVVWRVHHIDDAPYDMLDFFIGTEADMRKFYAYK